MIVKITLEDIAEIINDETNPKDLMALIVALSENMTTLDLLSMVASEVFGWLAMQTFHDIIKEEIQDKVNRLLYRQYTTLYFQEGIS